MLARSRRSACPAIKVSTDDLVKLKRIRKAAEQGEFDILLVFMYDRLGRNLNETPFIAEWFTKKGIHVWSVYEGEIIDGVDAERMLDYIRFWQTDEAQKTLSKVQDNPTHQPIYCRFVYKRLSIPLAILAVV